MKEQNLRYVLPFCYIIERLDFPNFIMNLLEDFNIQNFRWNLNFDYPREEVPQFHQLIDSKYFHQLTVID